MSQVKRIAGPRPGIGEIDADQRRPAARTPAGHRRARLRDAAAPHARRGSRVPWLGDAALAMLKLHTLAGQHPRTRKRGPPRAAAGAGQCPKIGPGPHRVRPGPRQACVEPAPVAAEPEADNGKLSNIVQISEARAIMATLEACGGHRANAASELGISERTLRYRLASFRDAGLAVGGGTLVNPINATSAPRACATSSRCASRSSTTRSCSSRSTAPGPAGRRQRQPCPAAVSPTRCSTALGKVNDDAGRSEALSDGYERGEVTDIAKVMLARQEAGPRLRGHAAGRATACCRPTRKS